MFKEANTTRDIRERKSDSRIKGKGEGSKQIGKDVRRSMTVKLQKELAERTRNRDFGNTAEAPPEAQAIEQTEKSTVYLIGGVKELTGDGFAKAVHRGKQAKREKQSICQRPATTTGDAQSPAADAAQPAAPPQERMKRNAAGDLRTHRAEAGRMPPASKERPTPEIVHERPKPSNPIKEHGKTAAPPTPKERMRQIVIKDKQTRRAEIREKPHTPREREQAAPLHERTTANASAPENIAAPPTPQERMRQKAVADLREKRIEEKRELTASRMEPRTASASPSAHIPESNGISPDNQSIYPSIRERPRRAAKPKEKPAGGAFTPKTRGSAKAPGTKAAPTAAKGKGAKQAAARAKRRFQQNAQRKLLQQANQRAAKRAVDLSRRAAVAIVKAVSSAIGAIAGLAGGAALLPVILVIILIGAIMASPFGILFANEPTPNAMPLAVAVGQLNMELADTLESLQTGDYDSIDLQGSGPDWREVVAVFAAKTTGDGADVAALTPERVERLRTVFWDMCAVTSEAETVDRQRILRITIMPRTAEDMRTQYAFTAYQNKALTELLDELAAIEALLTGFTA